jgi:hypothetical protein
MSGRNVSTALTTQESVAKIQGKQPDSGRVNPWLEIQGR